MSDPKNPLDNFRSYSYHHFLYASYHTEGLRQLFSPISGGVTDVTGNVTRRNGTGEYQLQELAGEFSDFGKMYKNRETILNLNENPVVFVINPLRDSDFTIESVNYNVLTQGDFLNGAHLISGELKMVVREAYGCSFLNYLKYLTDEIFECNWGGIAFCLKTVIIGWSDDERSVAKYFTVKPKILMLRNIESQFDETGSIYNLSFMDYTMGGALSDVGTGIINRGTSLKVAPKTLAKAMQLLQDELNRQSANSFGAFELKVLEPKTKKTETAAKDKNERFGRKIRYSIWIDEEIGKMHIDPQATTDTLTTDKNNQTATLETSCPEIKKNAEQKATEAKKQDDIKQAEKEKKSKVESDKIEKKWNDWKEYAKTYQPSGATRKVQGSDTEPTYGLSGQELLDCQCSWITKWNAAEKGKKEADLVYSIPSSPKNLEKQKSEREAKSAEAAKSQPEDGEMIIINSNVNILSAIGDILKRSSELKKACGHGAITKFKQAQAILEKAKKDSKAVTDNERDKAKATVEQIKSDYAKSPLFIFRVMSSITSNKDEVIIHYDIIKEYLPDPSVRNAYVTTGSILDVTKKPVGSCIEYDYIFTGKNQDILQFDMKQNMGVMYMMNDQLTSDRIMNTVTSAKTIDENGKTQAPNIQKNGDTINQMVTIQNEKTKQMKIIRRNDPILPSMQLADEKIGMSTYTQDGANTHKGYMDIFNRFCAMGALNAGMSIRGNPALLNSCATMIMPYDEVEYGKMMQARSELAKKMVETTSQKGQAGQELSIQELQQLDNLDMIHMPLFIKVNIFFPTGDMSGLRPGTVHNLVDTYAQGKFKKFWYEGWYYVTEIDNVFDGEFKQTLKLMAYNVNDIFNPEMSPGGGGK